MKWGVPYTDNVFLWSVEWSDLTWNFSKFIIHHFKCFKHEIFFFSITFVNKNNMALVFGQLVLFLVWLNYCSPSCLIHWIICQIATVEIGYGFPWKSFKRSINLYSDQSTFQISSLFANSINDVHPLCFTILHFQFLIYLLTHSMV